MVTLSNQTPHPEMKHQLTNIRTLWRNNANFSHDLRKAEFQLPTKTKAKRLKSTDVSGVKLWMYSDSIVYGILTTA